MRQTGLSTFDPAAATAPRLTVLSYGGGQDSTAILYRLLWDSAFRARYAPRDLIVVISDTGDEHPETYLQIERARRHCQAAGVPFTHLTPGMGFHSQAWQSLRHQYRRNNTVGSKAYKKTCTTNLKIGPIYRFLEDHLGKTYGVRTGYKAGYYRFASQHGPIRVLLGIAAGEEQRLGGRGREPRWMRHCIDKVYPLVELGMDRAACQADIRRWGEPVPVPSNCLLCPFRSLIELLWLHRNHPGDFEAWVELEDAKIKRFAERGVPPEKNFGVYGRKRLREALTEAEKRHGHMSLEDLEAHRMSHGHCVQSTY